MRRAALYISYYNATEPLVRSQVLAYLVELARHGIETHLLTFERERLSNERKRAMRTEFAHLGIQWHSLRYHQSPSLPATLYDIVVGALAAMRICRKHKIELIHARAHVPAAMALLLKKVLGYRMLFDLRGLMAEEYADAGHWREGGLKFRLTKGMERIFFRDADSIVVLTNRIKDELLAGEPVLKGRPDDIEVIPCCVDTTRYAVTLDQRAAYRHQRGWDGRRVLTYVGKLGTWYLADEMIRFFAALRREDPRFFFQVLTQSDASLMRAAFEAAGVAPEDYDIRFASPDALPLILSSADAAISFRKGDRSKRAASPTKVGECLAAGLPVVTNADIGDCDDILGGNRLGVILDDFSEDDYRTGAGRLIELLEDESMPERCRDFARRELSLSKIGGPRYGSVYDRILCPPSLGFIADTASIIRRV